MYDDADFEVLAVDDIRLVRAMAVADIGVALLPAFLCGEELKAGQLVRVLPEWQARADPIHLVYPRQRFVPPKLRVFVELAAEVLREALDRA